MFIIIMKFVFYVASSTLLLNLKVISFSVIWNKNIANMYKYSRFQKSLIYFQVTRKRSASIRIKTVGSKIVQNSLQTQYFNLNVSGE